MKIRVLVISTIGLLLWVAGVTSSAEDAPKLPVIQIGKEGFTLKSADQNFSLKVGGYTHADSRFYSNEDAAVDTFLLRRARLVLESTFYKYFSFRLMPDFGDGRTVIQDAYLEWNTWPMAKLRFGKFKGPVGLERLQSATNILFVERALPTNLVPNRDIGIQVSGDAPKSRWTYAIAVMNGVPDGASADTDTNDGKDINARLFVNPAADHAFLSGLGFGIATTYGDQGKTLPSYRTVGQLTFFSYESDVTADGNLYRLAPQLHYYNGPVTLLAEYVSSAAEITRPTVPSDRVTNNAWQLAVGWLVSGDSAAPRTFDPENPFDPSSGQYGALQLAARYSQLEVDEDIFAAGFADRTKSAEEAREIAFGVNWYLNRNVKLVVNYVRTNFEGGAAGDDRETENALLTRFQIAF